MYYVLKFDIEKRDKKVVIQYDRIESNNNNMFTNVTMQQPTLYHGRMFYGNSSVLKVATR